MACLDESTFVELLVGGLPPARAAQVDAHLDACPTCRRLVADALRAQAPDEGPPGEATALTPPRPSRAEEAPLEKGTAVGRYLVLERLGAGGDVALAAVDRPLLGQQDDGRAGVGGPADEPVRRGMGGLDVGGGEELDDGGAHGRVPVDERRGGRAGAPTGPVG